MQAEAEAVVSVVPAPELESRVGITEIVSAVPRLLGKWWVAFAVSTILGVTGHLLIKAGINAASGASVANPILRVAHLLLQPEIEMGLLIYVAGSACWLIAVAQKEISFLYPLSSINYVLILLASVLVLHEGLSLRRAGGVAVIISGMFLLNLRRPKQ
jgi:drug/metabolite transporter (DMT)-like permease